MGHGMLKIAAATATLVLILSIAGSEDQNEDVKGDLTRLGESRLFSSKKDPNKVTPTLGVMYGEVEGKCKAAGMTHKLIEADITAFKTVCVAHKTAAKGDAYDTTFWYIVDGAKEPDLSNDASLCPFFRTEAGNCESPSDDSGCKAVFQYICVGPEKTKKETTTTSSPDETVSGNGPNTGDGTAEGGSGVTLLQTKSLIVTALLFSAVALGLHF